jgi:adenine-specific DNA-methyltransferase
MVDQSLIEYLKTKTKLDERKLVALVSYDLTDDGQYPLEDSEKQEIINAIEALKILDPACGSGAYPIGALQKIVYVLQTVDPDCRFWLEQKLKGVPELYKQKIINEVKSNPFDYTRKLDVIKNSIFGVDIQPIAVDVSRLRCFLTLVVESEIDDTKPNRGIEPLPNLDFKFVCANTLIGLPKLESNNLFEDHTGIEDLSAIMSEYFTANRSEKESIKTRFFNKQKDLLNRMIALKATGELTLKLTLWDPFSNKTNSWFDPEWMFGINGEFDVAIGNPPYIKEYTNKSVFDGLRDSDYYQGKMDLWSMFTCISIDFLKENGTLSFIGPNNWATNSGASILRDKVLRETELKAFIDFGDFKVFEQAGIQTMILILNKKVPNQKYEVVYLKIDDKSESEEIIFNKMFGSETKVEFEPASLSGKNITFATSELKPIFDKIQSKKNFELQDKEVGQGIVAAPDKYFLEKDISSYNDDEKKYLKEFFTASGKYISGDTDNFLFYISEKNFKDKNIEDYPNILKHFKPFEEVLNLAKIKYGTPNKPYYYLHREREESFFDLGPKIVCGVRVSSPSFFYTEKEYYGSRALNFIKTERVNLKYLTGILNSKLTFFWLKNKGKQLGDLLQVDKGPLLEIPLFVGSDADQKSISDLVDQILTLKNQDKDADTKNLEDQIDSLVYGLYGLNEAEIEIIKNS